MESTFLKFSADKLEQLASRNDVCLQKLDEDQVWLRGNENQNSIGNLVLHRCGNVKTKNTKQSQKIFLKQTCENTYRQKNEPIPHYGSAIPQPTFLIRPNN